MSAYSRDLYREIKLISMESELGWHKESLVHFDNNKYDFVEIHLSGTCDFRYSFVSGVIYEKVPDYHYDFVFVDGPNPGDKCDMDFIKILLNSTKTVSAMIDSRRTTALAYSVLLGRDKIIYYPFGFSCINNVSGNDLILSNKDSLHHSFEENIPTTHHMFLRGFFSSLFMCLLPMRFFD